MRMFLSGFCYLNGVKYTPLWVNFYSGKVIICPETIYSFTPRYANLSPLKKYPLSPIVSTEKEWFCYGNKIKRQQIDFLLLQPKILLQQPNVLLIELNILLL